MQGFTFKLQKHVNSHTTLLIILFMSLTYDSALAKITLSNVSFDNNKQLKDAKNFLTV